METGISPEEFRDISEMCAGPTRGDFYIDRTFSNLDNIVEACTIAPLHNDGEDGHVHESNHQIFYLTSRLQRKERYR